MLRTLDIENIAVIEKASVDFSKGFNVLTGETGAGKSIVVDSINAILGERTSKQLIRHGCDYAYVRAYFEDIHPCVEKKIRELGYDTEEGSVILSRRLSSSGKSICKVNGHPASVSILKEIGSLLVNIHGQHDSQALLNSDFHYTYLDMLLDDTSVLAEYKRAFKNFISIRKRLKELTENESDKEQRLEILNYQISELEDADIKPGQRESLVKRRALITKSEDLLKALGNVTAMINGDDETNGIESLVSLSSASLSAFEETENIGELFDNISDEVEIIKDKIEKIISSLDFDPRELEQIEEKLDLLYKFSSKYGKDEEEMLDFLDNARKKRDLINYSNEELENLNGLYDEAYEKAIKLADDLSNERMKAAKKFEESVKKELYYLDMPNMDFKVSFSKGILSSCGYDKIEFMISTNPGEPPKSLSKIASGGELSRIMLAIKNILSYNDTVGTLIFDEIDTGVSGKASQKIGLKLKSVSENTQVICVTHSAQIASNADNHFLIYKEIVDNRTYTSVKELDFDERKHELAAIMGGLNITDSLLESAREMLGGD